MGTEQRLDPIPQPGIAPAGAVQVRGPGGLVRLFGRFEEDLFDAFGSVGMVTPGWGSPINARTDAVCLTESGKNVRQPDSAPEMASRSQARAYVQWR